MVPIVVKLVVLPIRVVVIHMVVFLIGVMGVIMVADESLSGRCLCWRRRTRNHARREGWIADTPQHRVQCTLHLAQRPCKDLMFPGVRTMSEEI